MKYLLKTQPWVAKVWVNGFPTNELKHAESVLINPFYIITIEYAQNDLNEGSKITISQGLQSAIYYDDREPKELYELIKIN